MNDPHEMMNEIDVIKDMIDKNEDSDKIIDALILLRDSIDCECEGEE